MDKTRGRTLRPLFAKSLLFFVFSNPSSFSILILLLTAHVFLANKRLLLLYDIMVGNVFSFYLIRKRGK